MSRQKVRLYWPVALILGVAVVMVGCENLLGGGDDDPPPGDADTTAPAITLQGENELFLLLGGTFADPGCTASDDHDGSITDDVSVSGVVDMSTEGSYTLTYTVSDAAGNAATAVTRTVHVVHPVNARNYVYDRSRGSYRAAEGLMVMPVSIAFTTEGNVLVGDIDGRRIQEFTPDGAFVSMVYQGTDAVAGISTNANGDIYYSTLFGSEIVKLNAAGTELLRFGGSGTGNGQFNMPYQAVEYGSEIYVTDAYNHRIQVFDLDGNFLRKWGTLGEGEGEFNTPRGIAVHNDGRGVSVYVADGGNHRMQKFTTTGEDPVAWGLFGTGENEYSTPTGIWVDGANSRLYIADHGNDRIQVTDLLGNYFDQFGTAGSGDGQIDQPWGVALDGTDIYVAETGNARVQKFDSSYAYERAFGEGSFSDPGKFDYPMGICVDGADRVYVADGGNNRVQIFSSNGTHIETWDNSDLGFVSDVAYSTTTGNIYVANHNAARTIVPHTTAGVALQPFGGPGTADGLFWDDSTNALLLAIDSTGNVYVLETAYNRVQKFDSMGNHVTSWGNPGNDGFGTGGLVDPRAITVDGDDNVWVTDPSRSVLITYDPTGVVLDEHEYHPSGAVTADPRGNLWWAGYTGENGDPIVIKMAAGDLSSDGFVSFIPHGDDAQTVPWDGVDVAVDSAGNVYVLDFANYLVQKFLPADGAADPPF